MADISKEINDFKNAKYGKDVRSSMVSLAEKVNQEASGAAQTVSNYAAAETSRAQAEQDRQNAEVLREQNFELMQSQSQEATNAANNAAERAEQAAEGDVSLKTVTFEMAAARAGVQSGDTLAVAFGKLAKFCADLQDHAFNPLVNNGLANVAGVSALDAVQANPDVEDTMANKIAKLYSDLTSTINNLQDGVLFWGNNSFFVQSRSTDNKVYRLQIEYDGSVKLWYSIDDGVTFLPKEISPSPFVNSGNNIKSEGYRDATIQRIECDPDTSNIYVYLSDGSHRWFQSVK